MPYGTILTGQMLVQYFRRPGPFIRIPSCWCTAAAAPRHHGRGRESRLGALLRPGRLPRTGRQARHGRRRTILTRSDRSVRTSVTRRSRRHAARGCRAESSVAGHGDNGDPLPDQVLAGQTPRPRTTSSRTRSGRAAAPSCSKDRARHYPGALGGRPVQLVVANEPRTWSRRSSTSRGAGSRSPRERRGADRRPDDLRPARQRPGAATRDDGAGGAGTSCRPTRRETEEPPEHSHHLRRRRTVGSLARPSSRS